MELSGDGAWLTDAEQSRCVEPAQEKLVLQAKGLSKPAGPHAEGQSRCHNRLLRRLSESRPQFQFSETEPEFLGKNYQ